MKGHYIPHVTIIVLNYNGKRTLDACLKSVVALAYKNRTIICVDNDSRDGSYESARKNFSRIIFIKNPKNYGFSKGCNVGIRFALENGTDYILLVNNDASVEKKMLDKLVFFGEKYSECGILSPKILNPITQKIWFTGGMIKWLTMKAVHDLEQETNKNRNLKPQRTMYISGCVMLIKRHVFEKIGLFDEDYFLYYEDVDFSYRAQKSGFHVHVMRNAHAFHSEESNRHSDRKLYWLVRSGLLFFYKNSTPLKRMWYKMYVQMRKIKNLVKIILFKDKRAVIVRRAYNDFERDRERLGL